MSREKRAYPRRPVRWDAEVMGLGVPRRQVVIRDFCAGGLFLAHGETGARLPQDGSLPANVTLRFVDPASDRPREMAVEVVRSTPAGFAIAFSRPMPDVVTALAAVAESQSREASTSRPARARSRLATMVLETCEQRAAIFFDRIVPDFAAHIVDELFERARSAALNAQQNAYFAGYKRLRDYRMEWPGHYWDEVKRRLDEIATLPFTREHGEKRTATNAAELALVDERDFEDWLNRSEVVSRAESEFSRNLDCLTRRLSYSVGQRLNEETNPLAPAALTEALADTLPDKGLEAEAAQAVYYVFGQVVLHSVGDLYDDLNSRLREFGILPDIETEGPQIRTVGETRRLNASSSAPVPHPEEWNDPSPVADDLVDTPSLGVRESEAATASAEAKPDAQPGMKPHGGTRAPLPAIRELLRVQRELRESRVRNDATGQTVNPETAESRYSDEQVLEAVSRLQITDDDPGVTAATETAGLSDRLLAGLGTTDPQRLGTDTRDTVELIDGWFGDVGSNALNGSFLRDWSSRFALLALKVQLQSGAFLDTRRKPIHELLDELDRAGVALAAVRPDQQQALRQQIESVLERVLAEERARPEAVSEGAKELSELTERPLQTRAANMQKVLQQCEGTQKLERARRTVNEELDRRVAEREVPKALLDFIDGSWRSLLVLIRLRHGDAGQVWRRGLAAVDRLLVVLGTGDTAPRPIPHPRKVFGFIRRQLEIFGRETAETQHLLSTLADYAGHVCEHGRPPVPPLQRVTAPRTAVRPDAATEVDPEWLGQAKLLKVGDWVMFSGRDGAPEPLRLQWISEDGSRYVFVHRNGVRARETSQAELAQLMEAASVGTTEDLDSPLTDRQWRKKLQDMHGEMVRQATHDSLTDLLNRKAFAREAEAVASSDSLSKKVHAILHLGIDRFKVVNATLGHEIGDQLLVQVSGHLAGSLREGDFAARTGGDEFVVFLADCTAARAEVVAEEYRRMIQTLRFGEDGNTISVSVSVGLVSFTFGARTPRGVLKDADEACLAAKHAGGNQVHVITPDDREVQHLRTSMERAARIDAALEAGKLQLRAQRIQPLTGGTSRRLPFFEILIALRGDHDEAIPPSEFIPAAERFGRMPSVDRWVIRNTLEWCAIHPEVLNTIEAFTVNLSGPTLNDRTLPGFLVSELERTGVAAHKICFEITETMAIQNLDRAVDLIRAIRDMGCQFSLDDFGSGHASYTYLKNLPVDYLKIDGAFIREIDHDEADFAMVRCINELAHYLGKRTIGEYVENDRILDRVRELGLDYAQGFRIGHPTPLEELSTDIVE